MGIVGTGSAVGMTVNGGEQRLCSGDTATGTTVINGGQFFVASGGMDRGATVGPGGTLNVLSPAPTAARQ